MDGVSIDGKQGDKTMVPANLVRWTGGLAAVALGAGMCGTMGFAAPPSVVRQVPFAQIGPAAPQPRVGQNGQPNGLPGAVSDAAPYYRRAFASMPRFEEWRSLLFHDAASKLDAEITDEVREVAAEYHGALDQLELGVAQRQCLWGLNYRDGPMLRLPHADEARQLARAALLRSRIRTIDGDFEGSIRDHVSALTLGRHVASDPLLICLLVNYAIDGMTTQSLAAQLTQYPPESLRRLQNSLSTLPAIPTAAHCVREEGRMIHAWLGDRFADRRKSHASESIGDSVGAVLGQAGADEKSTAKWKETSANWTMNDVDAALARMAEHYRQVAEYADRPFVEAAPLIAKLEASLKPNNDGETPDDAQNVFSRLMLPSTANLLKAQERHRGRRVLLNVAIKLRLDGGPLPEQVAVGNRTVKIMPTETGFHLACLMEEVGDAVDLTVGNAAIVVKAK